MRKAVYIIAAALSAAAAVYMLFEAIHTMSSRSKPFEDPLDWYSNVQSFYYIAYFIVMAVLSLIQLKKSTPKIMLIFSGAVFFTSLGFFFIFSVWYLIFMIVGVAAGLIPAVYEFIKHGRLVKKAPFWNQKYDGIMIASGVIACVCILFSVYAMISNINLYLRHERELLAVICFQGVVSVSGGVIRAVFCFLRNRRTSVLYRIFFIGSSMK